ncbi:unnamed protein product [Heligmosomoides polygyrus]|uniref:Uncharacterized protein n=1 Tax=Heligmosomoides polygyrus TaxID=6339 RepID=A0A3P8CUI6_HELPZ|nr:unnamed protein product [Heligmosomoides polygyrus]
MTRFPSLSAPEQHLQQHVTVGILAAPNKQIYQHDLQSRPGAAVILSASSHQVKNLLIQECPLKIAYLDNISRRQVRSNNSSNNSSTWLWDCFMERRFSNSRPKELLVILAQTFLIRMFGSQECPLKIAYLDNISRRQVRSNNSSNNSSTWLWDCFMERRFSNSRPKELLVILAQTFLIRMFGRDKNFLLDRLGQFEKFSETSDEDSDASNKTCDEKPKPKKYVQAD